MLLAETVEDIGGIKTGIVAELAGNDLESLRDERKKRKKKTKTEKNDLGICVDEKLLLARNGAGVVTKVLAELHLHMSIGGPKGEPQWHHHQQRQRRS